VCVFQDESDDSTDTSDKFIDNVCSSVFGASDMPDSFCSSIFGPPMIMPSFIQPVTMQGELNLSG